MFVCIYLPLIGGDLCIKKGKENLKHMHTHTHKSKFITPDHIKTRRTIDKSKLAVHNQDLENFFG